MRLVFLLPVRRTRHFISILMMYSLFPFVLFVYDIPPLRLMADEMRLNYHHH